MARASRDCAIASRKERKRKIVSRAMKPTASENAPIAICWPTEYAVTTDEPPKTFTSSACWTPAPPGVNGTTAATALTPSTSRTFSTEPPTPNASSRHQNAVKRNNQPANCQANTSRT